MQHIPSVLRKQSTVEESHLHVRCHLYHSLWRVGGKYHLPTLLKRLQFHERIRSAVVIGLEPLELSRLLLVGTGIGIAYGIARQSAQPAIHHKRLEPVLRRKELHVEASLAFKECRNRLVEVHFNPCTLALTCHHNPAFKIIVVVSQHYLYLVAFLVHLSAHHLRHEIPLLRGVAQSHGTTLCHAHPVLYNLDAGVLLIVESSVETIAEYEQVDALLFKILIVVKSQLLCVSRQRAQAE